MRPGMAHYQRSSTVACPGRKPASLCSPACSRLLSSRPLAASIAHRRHAALVVNAVSSWSTYSAPSGSGDGAVANNGTAGASHPSNSSSGSQYDAGAWGTNAYSNGGVNSTWEESNGSPWPAIVDWGETANLGDWGEPATVGQANWSAEQTSSIPGQQQQQQQQQYASNLNAAAAGGSSYTAGPAAAGASGNSNNGFGVFGASSSSAQDPYAAYSSSSTAAGPGLYSSNFDPSAPSSAFNSSSSSSNGQLDSVSGTNYGQQQSASWPFADAFGTQQQQQQQQQFRGSGGDMNPPLMPSDITLIGRRDADSMLPLAPSVDQARYYQPRSLSERVVQVVGSFGVSMVLSKSALLAGPALLYPVWGPWIRAGIRNVQMYLRQFKCVGLWRAEVLAVQINTIPYAYRDAAAGGDTVTITVGDPWQGGARTELTFPYQPGCEDIVEGEPAEVLVLCHDDTFINFKVVREVYLPQSGMWLSEYPFVDRDVFLDVSLAIERGRQAAAAEAAGGTGFGGLGGFAAPGPTASYTAAATAEPVGPGGFAGPAGYAAAAPAAGFAPAEPSAFAAFANGGSTAAGGGAGAWSAAAEWVVPGAAAVDSTNTGNNSSSSQGSGSGPVAPNVIAADTDAAAPAAAAAASTGAMYNNVSSDGRAPSSSSGAMYDGDNNGSSSSSSSTASSSGSSSGFMSNPLPSMPAGSSADLVGEFASVASQVTGVATNVASDVASGVAAGVVAGLGWLSGGAAGSSSGSSGSNGDSSSDNAVVPDVIIDNQGVWSPVGGYAGGSNAFGSSGFSSRGSSWGNQPIDSQYGAPYVDQGFTGLYQRDFGGYGSSRYAGTNFYQPPAGGFAGMGGSFAGPAASSPGGLGSFTAGPAGTAADYSANYNSSTAGFSSSSGGYGWEAPQRSDRSADATAGQWVPYAAQGAAAVRGNADAGSPQAAATGSPGGTAAGSDRAE